MRNLIIVAAIVSIPIATATSQPTKAAVAAAAASRAGTVETDGGGTSRLNTPAAARNVLEAIRQCCQLVENDGKLFAACDNTTAAARTRGSTTYVPQNASEWENFTRLLSAADKIINGKGRPVTVLNGGDVVAEATSGGVVTLKK
jgi:hypothetical protein